MGSRLPPPALFPSIMPSQFSRSIGNRSRSLHVIGFLAQFLVMLTLMAAAVVLLSRSVLG